MHRTFSFLFVVLALSGCVADPLPGVPAEEALPTPEGQTSARVSPPFDVPSLIDRARFGFQPEGGTWVGGAPTYQVRTDGAGVAIRPFHVESTPAGDELVEGGALTL